MISLSLFLGLFLGFLFLIFIFYIQSYSPPGIDICLYVRWERSFLPFCKNIQSVRHHKFHLYIDTFVINYVSIYGLYSVPLVYLSLFSPITYFIGYCRFILYLNIQLSISTHIFLPQECHGYSLPLIYSVPYTLESTCQFHRN